MNNCDFSKKATCSFPRPLDSIPMVPSSRSNALIARQHQQVRQKKDSGRGPHFSGADHHQYHQAAGAKLFSVRLPTHSGRLPDIWTGNKTHGNNVNQAPIAPPHFLVVGQSRDDILTAVLPGSPSSRLAIYLQYYLSCAPANAVTGRRFPPPVC